MRTHIIVPEELIEEIDRIAGKRKRSRFVEEAIREKLEREALGRAMKEVKGMLDPADYPEWSTPEKVSAWIRESRAEDDAVLERKLRRSSS